MIKVCLGCRSTWAGGQTCEDCGARLVDTFDAGAASFPRSIWGYIRLQYGARRGMLVRVMALILGPVAAALLARRALILPMPWSILGVLAAALAGFGVWFAIHWLAGRAVRIWVLRKGQLKRGRLARIAVNKLLGKAASPAPSRENTRE